MLIKSSVVEAVINDGYSIINLDVQQTSVISTTFQKAYEFFTCPPHLKKKNFLPHDCGYRAQGTEFSQTAERPDQMESFTATGRNIDLSGLGIKEGRRLYHHMRAVIEILEPIVENLAIEFAQRAEPLFDRAALHNAFRDWSCLQFNYSRPAESSCEMINDSHEDGHVLTLACADHPGLEIQTKSGQFIPLLAGEGSFVVMPGEVGYLLSGGLIKPLYHQVRRDPSVKARLALVYFGEVDPAHSEPWVRNHVNDRIDIGAITKANASRFGLVGFEQD